MGSPQYNLFSLASVVACGITQKRRSDREATQKRYCKRTAHDSRKTDCALPHRFPRAGAYHERALLRPLVENVYARSIAS